MPPARTPTARTAPVSGATGASASASGGSAGPTAATASSATDTATGPTAANPAVQASAEAGPNVTVVPGIARYHKPDCILIRFLGEEDLEILPLASAEESGCVACRACRPGQD
jgi:hypothetical protein